MTGSSVCRARALWTPFIPQGYRDKCRHWWLREGYTATLTQNMKTGFLRHNGSSENPRYYKHTVHIPHQNTIDGMILDTCPFEALLVHVKIANGVTMVSHPLHGVPTVELQWMAHDKCGLQFRLFERGMPISQWGPYSPIRAWYILSSLSRSLLSSNA